MRLKGVSRRFPISAAAWSVQLSAAPTPDNIWVMQEASLNLVDSVGGKDFTSSVATVNFHVTGDPLRAFGAQTASNTGYFGTAAPTTDFDITNKSHTWFLRLKLGNALNSRILIGKKATAAGSNGWRLGTNSSGNLVALVDSPGAAATTFATASNHNDGNYHDVMLVIDRDTFNEMDVYSDLDTSSITLGAHTTFTNAVAFGIGDGNAASACAFSTITYMAHWGSALTQANYTTIVTPA